MKKVHIIFLLVIAVAFSSCFKKTVCIHGEGNVVEKKVDVTNFSQIDFAIAGNLHLKQSDTFGVVIMAQQNILDVIETEVRGSKLVIKSDDKCLEPGDSITVYVSAPQLNEISLTGDGNVVNDNQWKFNSGISFKIVGSGNINFFGFFTQGNVEANISGTGDIYLKNFNAQDLKNSIIGEGDITEEDVELEEALSNKIIGTGNILVSTLDTIADNTLKISGSGKIDTYGVPAENVDVDISGTGNIYVRAIKKLNVSISGSGNVYYKGSPTITTDISGEGNVVNTGD